MWISKKEYEELNARCDNCDYQLTERVIKEPLTAIFTNNAIIMSVDLYLKLCDEKESIVKEREDMQSELQKYQKMYADEVQKRLALIEQLGDAQAT